MFRKRESKVASEIPSASLADIAFLLLIFFLVVTTIDVDTGIGLVLPPPPQENEPPPQINDRNLLNINVNAQGNVQLDGELTSIAQIKEQVKTFIMNNGQNPEMSDSPEEAVISLKTARETSYNIYVDVLDEIVGAYIELRNAASMSEYGVPFSQLEDGSAAQEAIEDVIPKQLSIAEPAETS